MMATEVRTPLVMVPGSMSDRRLFPHQFDAFGSGATVGDPTGASSIEDTALQRDADTFLQQNEALLQRRYRRDDLASLSVSILVACGREDRLCPVRIHEDLAARIPGAELVVIEEAGHLATSDQPEALTRALSSWRSTCQDTTLIH